MRTHADSPVCDLTLWNEKKEQIGKWKVRERTDNKRSETIKNG